MEVLFLKGVPTFGATKNTLKDPRMAGEHDNEVLEITEHCWGRFH